MHIKNNKIYRIKESEGCTPFQLLARVLMCPVRHGHVIIAVKLESIWSKVIKALAKGLDMLAPFPLFVFLYLPTPAGYQQHPDVRLKAGHFELSRFHFDVFGFRFGSKPRQGIRCKALVTSWTHACTIWLIETKSFDPNYGHVCFIFIALRS